MTSRLGHRVLALSIPAVLLVPPGAAHAERVATTDPAGDVVMVGPTDQGEGDLANLVPAPDNQTADIVGTVVDHDRSRLKVRVDLRDLGRARLYFAVLQVRTPTGTFEVETDNLGRRPKVEMTRRSRAIDCPRLAAAADPETARAVITIPTVCLGSPRWVQVGVGVASAEAVIAADGTEEVFVFADDAHRDGAIRDSIAKGPRIDRG